MNSILKKSYQAIFGREPDPQRPDWQMAEDIIKNWDVPKLGEELAKVCLFEIILHVAYPNFEITRAIVGQAEEFAPELFEELSNLDPHMDVIEVLEKKYHEGVSSGLTEKQESSISKKLR